VCAYSLPYLTCEAVVGRAVWQSLKRQMIRQTETIYASRRAHFQACAATSAEAQIHLSTASQTTVDR